MNPRRRRHNRLVRKGHARFQLALAARRRSREERRQAVQQELTDELRKFVGRRHNGELRRDAIRAATVRMLERILPGRDVRVVTLAFDDHDPAICRIVFGD